MHVRQVAWLQAKPRDAKGKPGEASRLAQMRSSGGEPHIPDAGPAGYLAGYLWEAGPTMAGGMGPVPIGWQELAAWQSASGICLSPWEALTMRRCSMEYVAELHSAEAPGAPAPSVAVDTSARSREAVATRLGGLFSGLASKPAGNAHGMRGRRGAHAG